MKELAFIILTLLSNIYLNAQETKLDSILYFSTLFNPYIEISDLLSQGIEIVDDGYLVFGNYAQSQSDHRLYLRKINNDGEEVWFKDYDFGKSAGQRGLIGSGEQVIQNTSGNLVLAYSYDTTNLATGARRLFKLVEMDVEGNILQSALLGEDTTKRHIARAIVEVEDGYVFTGYQGSVEENTSRIAVIKVDFDFKEVWTKYYAESFGDAYRIRKTNWDNGFIIGGWSFTDDYWRYDNYTIKLNSNGNLEWEYIDNITGETSSAMPIIPYNPTSYSEQEEIEYIILSSQEPHESENAFNFSKDLTFTKLDKDGNLLFKKVYDNGLFDRCVNFEMGFCINDSTLICTILNNYDISSSDVLLADISTIDGEVRWVQTLQTNDDEYRQDYLRDLHQTPDGGYIMAGYRKLPGVQRSWVVKTDSLGNTCGFADCDSLVVIETIIEEPEDSTGVFMQNIEETDFKVYPNPAKNKLYISFSNHSVINQLNITNSIGQTVLTKNNILPSNQIDISSIANGLYFINFYQNGRFISRKFVKE